MSLKADAWTALDYVVTNQPKREREIQGEVKILAMSDHCAVTYMF